MSAAGASAACPAASRESNGYTTAAWLNCFSLSCAAPTSKSTATSNLPAAVPPAASSPARAPAETPSCSSDSSSMAPATTADDHQPGLDGPRPAKMVKPSPDECAAALEQQQQQQRQHQVSSSPGSPVRRPEPDQMPQLAVDDEDEFDDSDSAVGSDRSVLSRLSSCFVHQSSRLTNGRQTAMNTRCRA